MKKIRIQSSQTVYVTPDFKVRDLTDPHSMAPNKLKAVMDWDYKPVKILAGVSEYDALIRDWKTVKVLEAAGVITISDMVNTQVKEDNQEIKKVKKIKLEEI